MNFVQPIRDLDKIVEVRAFLADRNARNELLFCFGIYTGLRISDILRIKVKDVKGKNVFFVKEQKTQKTKKKGSTTKRIPILASLRKMIDKYVIGLVDEEYLFKSRQGRNKPITRVRAYDILREAAYACSLEEIGTHTLRKTFGYHMYQETKDIALLQDIFNHSAEYITRKYIGINQEAIDAAYKKLPY